MMTAVRIIAAILYAAAAGFGVLFVVTSVLEKERRAAVISGVGTALFAAAGVASVVLQARGVIGAGTADGVAIGFAALVVIGVVACLAPIGRNPAVLRGSDYYLDSETNGNGRFDRRRSIFFRHRVEQGTEEHDALYEAFPELKDEDEESRRRIAETRTKDSKFDAANVTGGPLRQGIMSASRPLAELSRPEAAAEVVEISPEELTRKVKALALHLGAGDVGVAEARPWYFYANPDGEEEFSGVRDGHTRVVAMAFEMQKNLVDAAPHSPIIIETMTRYAEGAFVSVQVASFLAAMGYKATANHISNYEMLMVPPAIDAGLGELGRSGFLMSRKFGPRCRLAAVTTTAPLVVDSPVDIGAQEFCRVCFKCAVTCPSRSIPDGEKTVVRGVRKWQLDDCTCHEFWQKVGTDCGICMRNCPYSHPKRLVHRIGALATRSSPIARRLLAWADDLVYGKRPKARAQLDWIDWRKP